MVDNVLELVRKERRKNKIKRSNSLSDNFKKSLNCYDHFLFVLYRHKL